MQLLLCFGSKEVLIENKVEYRQECRARLVNAGGPVLVTTPTQFNTIKLTKDFFIKRQENEIAIFTGVKVKKRQG